MMLKKRIISCVLALSISFSMALPAFAYEKTNLSQTALLVSEEYAASYPNGVFEFATVRFETRSRSGRTTRSTPSCPAPSPA